MTVKGHLIDLSVTFLVAVVIVAKKSYSNANNVQVNASSYFIGNDLNRHVVGAIPIAEKLTDERTVNGGLDYQVYYSSDGGEEDNGNIETIETINSSSGESGQQENEEAYSSGVLSINELSKDERHLGSIDKLKKNKKQKEIKSSKTKDMMNKNKQKTSKSFTLNSGHENDIDLEYLQKLFDNKNIHEFQMNHTEQLNRKVLKEFRANLYSINNTEQLKILENFDRPKQSTQKNLKKAIEAVLKDEESSIRYRIQFPSFYHSVGTITMPYDDLVEPFESWYAGDLNMSRIDYYQGLYEIGKNRRF